MAVINVRVDDLVHEQLKELAAENGVTLSDFVRDQLLEVLVRIREPETRHGDLPVPESFSTRDRLMLSLLHRILARVLPDDANDVDGDEEYQLRKAEVIEAGFTGEYWLEVAGFETELSKRDSERVIDILQMFRVITFSIDRLKEDGVQVDDKLASKLAFKGFDHNDSLEGHMARYVRHLMRDGDHWSELIPQIKEHDNGNSHMQMLDIYIRMLLQHRKIMNSRSDRHRLDSYLLTLEELHQIADSMIHPSHRN